MDVPESNQKQSIVGLSIKSVKNVKSVLSMGNVAPTLEKCQRISVEFN